MKFLLYCNQDPRALGIEDDQGNCDNARFKAHIQECPHCQYLLDLIGEGLLDLLDDLDRAKKGRFAISAPRSFSNYLRQKGCKQWKK